MLSVGHQSELRLHTGIIRGIKRHLLYQWSHRHIHQPSVERAQRPHRHQIVDQHRSMLINYLFTLLTEQDGCSGDTLDVKTEKRSD